MLLTLLGEVRPKMTHNFPKYAKKMTQNTCVLSTQYFLEIIKGASKRGGVVRNTEQLRGEPKGGLALNILTVTACNQQVAEITPPSE